MHGHPNPFFGRVAAVVAIVALPAMMFGCAASSTVAEADLRSGPMVPLRVIVTGVMPGGGPVRCAVYVNASDFMTRAGIWDGQSHDPTGSSVEFRFWVPEGTKVAVSAFQDSDNDEDLDRGPLGLPTEPWGTSGARAALAPPSWSRSAILPNPDGQPVSVALAGGKRNRSAGDRSRPRRPLLSMLCRPENR